MHIQNMIANTEFSSYFTITVIIVMMRAVGKGRHKGTAAPWSSEGVQVMRGR